LLAFALRLNVSSTTGGAIAAAIAEDGGVFTDETAEANEGSADDMTIFPAVPVAEVDRYNFGFTTAVGGLSIDTSTAATGTHTVVWEYWDGAAWSALSGVTDGTTNFHVSGAQTVTWTVPADWAKSVINGQGPYYFVRAEIQTGSVTQIPIGEQAFDLEAPTTIRILQG